MPKKQKQKQKQKQSQKTSVVVNVGASKKGVSRRPKTAPIPPPTNPQSISVTLQGSSMNLPAPLTNDYNKILQQLDLIRREQAQAGSLISNVGRNDLLNRVQATNPFLVASKNTQTAMLDPYEGETEEVVESGTASNSYDNNSSDAQIPINQDFIRQARINRFEQTLGGNTYKIGVGDVETVSDLSAYDDEDFEDRLAESVKDNALVEKVKMMSEDIYARKAMKDLERQILDKNYERFLKKGKEEESYLTRRINPPNDEFEIIPKTKKQIEQENKIEIEKEKKRQYQREYQREYRRKKKEGK